MSHRTYGATRDCMGCRHWSEMIAMSVGGGPVQAMCINKASPRYMAYVMPRERCTAWESGHLGAVDEPGEDPLRYVAEAVEGGAA